MRTSSIAQPPTGDSGGRTVAPALQAALCGQRLPVASPVPLLCPISLWTTQGTPMCYLPTASLLVAEGPASPVHSSAFRVGIGYIRDAPVSPRDSLSGS